MTAALLVPLLTPVDTKGGVVENDVRRLIESVAEHATGLLPALSSGEGWRLSDEQWGDLVSATVRHAHGLPVYVGLERPTTAEAVRLAQAATGLGAHGVVATAPFAPVVSDTEAIAHFRSIAEQAGLPLVLYNESALSGNVCSPALLAQCCALPGVIGVKESSGSADTAAYLLRSRVNVPIYQGWERLIGQPLGLAGCAVGLANIEPAWCLELAGDPGSPIRCRVEEACLRHHLYAEDWYRHLKIELVRRGILSTARAVDEPREES